MIDFKTFFQRLSEFELCEHSTHFEQVIKHGFSTQRFGDLPQWLEAYKALPAVKADKVELKEAVELTSETLDPVQAQDIDAQLRKLIPWRKGPFQVFNTYIDTEWRSDMKWDRVKQQLSPLRGRKVLDVGCGSGYHCWRMLGEGARWVLGIDPSPRFVVQFEMIKHFTNNKAVDVIPIGIEHLPPQLSCFDTVFSMGVLYHRTSPIDHIKELREALKPGGELVLETLVIEGDLGQSLVPDDRYAKMRNVWFIPSVPTLLQWLKKCGFDDVRCVDLNQTSFEEQRRTDWMINHSLKEFLDPNDHSQTAEGHPAPLRAVIIAKRPGKLKLDPPSRNKA